MGDGRTALEAHLRDVELPHPREDSIEAIFAVHEFLARREAATRDEIITELTPEKHHRIGLVAAQTVGKLNEVDDYRSWWWDAVVVPGIRALPSIDEDDGRWYMVDRGTDRSVPERPDRQPSDEIQQDRRDSTKSKSTLDEIEAGSPRSLTERADAISAAVASDPDSVDTDELYELLADPRAPPSVHLTATDALRQLAGDCDGIDARFVEPIIRLLRRPALGPKHTVLWCLSELAEQEPRAVLKASETICGFVTPEATEETTAALACCVELVGTERVAFIHLAPRLSELVTVDDRPTSKRASYLLGQLAKDHPIDVAPAVAGLSGALDSIGRYEQSQVLIALGLTSPYLEDVDSVVESVLPLVDEDDSTVRGNATAVLADVTSAVPALGDARLAVELLDDDDPHVRANAATIILNMATESPTACADAVEPLIDLLDDQSGSCRRNACRALGQLEAEAAHDTLQAKAMFDPDAGVRAAATAALESLRS